MLSQGWPCNSLFGACKVPNQWSRYLILTGKNHFNKALDAYWAHPSTCHIKWVCTTLDTCCFGISFAYRKRSGRFRLCLCVSLCGCEWKTLDFCCLEYPQHSENAHTDAVCCFRQCSHKSRVPLAKRNSPISFQLTPSLTWAWLETPLEDQSSDCTKICKSSCRSYCSMIQWLPAPNSDQALQE